MELYQWLPPDALKMILVLFLSFLIGLEREEHKVVAGSYSFGGVRTFPLIGLIGYSIALLSGTQLLPLTVGFLVVGAFLLLSYWHKLSASRTRVLASPRRCPALRHFWWCAGLLWTFLDCNRAQRCQSSAARSESGPRKLASRIPPDEILTFAKFLLLSGVILPVLPNQEFGRFHINFFTTWLVVVAVSAISYGSYVLQKVLKGRGGVVLAALLGGAYSSTVATVALARQAAREQHPHLFAGGILIASAVTYLRLGALLVLLAGH